MIRPEKELEVQNQKLIEAIDFIDKKNNEKAEESLHSFSALNEFERSWIHYLSGVIAFEKQEFDRGMELLQIPYSNLKKDPSNSRYDADYHRLVAKCLKKIGWNFRRLKEYEKAYFNHSVAYQIYDRFGAYAELHDAAISLDVDAYFLGDAELDEYWLRKSIDAGNQIPLGKRKFEALGTSYNNLAGTLYGLKKFGDAESSIKESFAFWKSYEEAAGVSENRLVWAYFGIGDVYQAWAQHFKELKEEKAYFAKKALSAKAYQEALDLSIARKMGSEDQNILKKKIAELKAETI